LLAVAGTGEVRVKDGSAGVEPFNGPVGSLSEFLEVGVVLGSDGAVLPFVVDCFDVVRPAVASRGTNDHFDTEVEAYSYPVGERVVWVGGFDKGVVDTHCKRDR